MNFARFSVIFYRFATGIRFSFDRRLLLFARTNISGRCVGHQSGLDLLKSMIERKVLGVLAGTDMPRELLARWAASADFVVAADGGADRLRESGRHPDITLGDLDSVTPEALAESPVIRLEADQNFTDCDKLLMLIQNAGDAEVTIACAEGDLPDHFLAALSSAAACRLRVRFAFRRGIGWLLRGGDEVCLRVDSGQRVSLLPLTKVEDATVTGVRWPLFDAVLESGRLTSVSNVATEHEIVAHIGSGAALLFVEYEPKTFPCWPAGSDWRG